MNYRNFNKREILNSTDKDLLIDAVVAIKNDETKNMVYGLMDGYIYNDLAVSLQIECFNAKTISVEMFSDLVELMDKIRQSLDTFMNQ